MVIEKVFLGCLLKAGYLINDTVIRPEQLKDARHQNLMRDMLAMNRAGKPVDIVAMTTLPNLKEYGGMSYLVELESYADIGKFEEIEKLILDEWKEREKKNVLQNAIINDWEIEKVLRELDKINENFIDDHTSIIEALAEWSDAPWEEPEPANSVPTGILKLDTVTGGFQPGELTIIAARPSMGKTDVMLHFAKEAGWAGFLPLIFSLEMPKKLITNRLIASTGRYNRRKLRNPKELLSRKQKEIWPGVINHLRETNIQIFDGAAQTVLEIRAKTRKMIHQFPEKKPIVFIDYLTLIRSGQFYNGNAHQQVSEISIGLKTWRKSLAVRSFAWPS